MLGKDGLVIKKSSEKTTRNFKRMPKHFGPAKKLGVKDEMLLCLIKVRLDTPLQNLANQFKVSSFCKFFFYVMGEEV